MAGPAPRFEPSAIAHVLLQTAPGAHWWVAYSGGVDSTALLLATEAIARDSGHALSALHVHHGIHPDADDWADHCAVVCEQLGISLTTEHVQADPSSRKGLEGELRDRRYEVLADRLGPDDVALAAHHREDQAETLLLNLLRGSGPEGLASMPVKRPLGAGWLVRPLLDWPRESLRDYVRDAGIGWIEDASNADTRHDRNYLRHAIIPLLEQRWPGTQSALARSARFAGEHADLLSHWGEELLAERLCLDRMLELPVAELSDGPRFRMLLRQWVKRADAPIIPVQRLVEFQRQCDLHPEDGSARLSWRNWHMVQEGPSFWLMTENEQPIPCRRQKLAHGHQVLGAQTGTMELKVPAGSNVDLFLDCRQPGDRLSLGMGQPRRSIKRVMAHCGVPDWLRDSIPVVRAGHGLIAIGDWAIDAEFAANGGGVQWSPASPILRLAQARARQRMVASRGLLG